MTLDPSVPIEGIPEINLDEWAVDNHEVDPFSHMDEVGLGIYLIWEPDVIIPNLVKDKKNSQKSKLSSFASCSMMVQGVK